VASGLDSNDPWYTGEMKTHTSTTKADPNRLFEIRLTFPVYPDPDDLSALLENFERWISSGETVNLENPETFYDVFDCGITSAGWSIFDRESFSDRCVEVYSPDSPPALEYPPATVDGLPGIALVITETLMAQQFTIEGDPVPATAEQARRLFVDSGENPYDTMNEWNMGITSLDSALNRRVQIVVDNRLFEARQAKQIWKRLKSLAVKTGVLDAGGVSHNPYSSKYRPPGPSLGIR
jgi:hypothetical protein